MRIYKKKLFFGLFVMVFIVLAEWIGEDTNRLNFNMLGVVAVGASIASYFFVRRFKIWVRLLSITVVLVLVVGSWMLGEAIAGKAFNECVDRRDSLVRQLNEFKNKKGVYPVTLSELQEPLPGRRFLRPNILVYKRNDKRFSLSFSDWLVDHSTNQTGEWNVSK